MKAARVLQFGPPSMIQNDDLPRPEPAAGQLKASPSASSTCSVFSLPIDRDELIASARAAGGLVVTVEDHYQHGGLGDAVLSALAQERVKGCKLAVREIAHSGKAEELIEKFGISSRDIVNAVKSALRDLPAAITR